MTSVGFMSSKQYRIVFGYFLESNLRLITAIIDVIAKFYVIQEKWSKSSSMINLEENDEYCEWYDCGYPDGHISVFGNVLFKGDDFCFDESLTLRWKIEYSIPHLSNKALFIGISNFMTYTPDSPVHMWYGDHRMFAGYRISFYNRKNDNPYIEKFVKGREVIDATSEIFSSLKCNKKDGLQPDDLVFGIITFIVNFTNGYIHETLSVYPHPVTAKKMSNMNNSIALKRFSDSKPSFHWLACSFPFGGSLKLDYFACSGTFYYRDDHQLVVME